MSLKHNHSPLTAQLVEPDDPDDPKPLPNRSRAATIGASSRASIRSLVDVFNHPQRPKSSTIKPPKTPKMHNSYSILSLASLLHDDYIHDELVRSPPGSPNKLSPTKSRLLRKSRSRILGSIDHTKDPGPVTPEATVPHLKPYTRNGVRVCPLPVRDVPYPLSYDRVLLQCQFDDYRLLSTLYGPAYTQTDLDRHRHLRVLDLGCGQGHWAIELAHSCKHAHVVGFDVTDVQLTTSVMKHQYGLSDRAVQRLSFTHGNFMQRLPFPDATFDFVRLSDLTLAVPRYAWGLILTEVHRVLKPSGWVELIADDFFVPRLEFNLESPNPLFNDDAEESFYNLLSSLDIDPTVQDMGYLLHEIFVHGAHEPHSVIKNTVEFRIPLLVSPDSTVERPYGGKFRNSSTSTGWSGSSGACAGSYSCSDHTSEDNNPCMSSSGVAGSATIRMSDWTEGPDTSLSYYQDYLLHDGSAHRQSVPTPRPWSSLRRKSRLNPPGLIVEQTGNSQLPCVRFLPMTLDEIITHSTKHMHVVLAARESVWDMHPDNRKTEEVRRKFLDEFFDFEEGMLDRLGLPRRAWYDSDSDTSSFNPSSVQAHAARPTTLLDTSHVFAAPRVTVRRLHFWTARKALEVDADVKRSSKRHGLYGTL